MSTTDWHQQQLDTLAAARERVAAQDRRLLLRMKVRRDGCAERLAASDAAMARGDYARAITLLQEELGEPTSQQR